MLQNFKRLELTHTLTDHVQGFKEYESGLAKWPKQHKHRRIPSPMVAQKIPRHFMAS